ncbi:MAG: rhodanese-like domain-containing protein [Bacteroidetes bacterium]|jgi:rhodanese-related sulfurtransferase|nr:rhodanese-like domain-containing protein [Bacteroidota bacterium]
MLDFFKKLLGTETVDFADLKSKGAIIVDVRSKSEFESGHIKNSINIPLNNLSQQLNRLKNKEQIIITCCASGMRSASAKTILKNNGYTQVYNGGGWYGLQNKL